MFCQWAIPKDILYFPRELSEEDDERYSLTSKAYILMKRLGQNYGEIMSMDAEERDNLFEMEMKLIKEEAKQNESKK